jgi:hypothetical protein
MNKAAGRQGVDAWVTVTDIRTWSKASAAIDADDAEQTSYDNREG